MGFSVEWLDLREPADAAARDKSLLRQAAAAAGPNPVILDLGCGTGAMMRALTPYLGTPAQWRLLDNDLGLLERAAISSENRVDPVLANLTEIEALPLQGITLVTASALLDLVSETWLSALTSRLEVPFYAALTYDGVMRWTPEDPRDADIALAFNRHQCSDKGFGPALGPDAVSHAEAILSQAGFGVRQADSPWRLTPDMHELQIQLTDGIAGAAAESGLKTAEDWRHRKRTAAAETSCLIGHKDLLAIPRTVPHNAPDAAY